MAGVLVALDAARRGLRLRNMGANQVATGGADIVFASAAVVIQPGETWNEKRSAGRGMVLHLQRRVGVYSQPPNYRMMMMKKIYWALIALAFAVTLPAQAAGSGIVEKLFVQPGAGAVSHKQNDKIAKSISVRDFGAAGNCVADDTANIRKAITAAAAGRSVFFPQGCYLVSGVLDITATTAIIGESIDKTKIRSNALNAKIFNISAPWTTIERISLEYTGGTPVAGATAIYSNASYTYINRVIINSAHIGIHFQTNAGQFASQFQVLNYESSGVVVQNINDVTLTDFILNAGNTKRGVLGGIRMIDKAEAIIVSHADIILGSYSMMTTATVNAKGSRPAYNRFTSVYFDSSVNGVLLDKTADFTFSNSWFSNRPGTGCNVSNSIGATFENSTFANGGSHGCIVQNTSTQTTFKGNKFIANNSAAVGAHGLVFAAGTTDFIVQGNTFKNGFGFAGLQGYGVIVNAGTSDRYIISDNLVTGNAIGGVSDGGTGTNKHVANNY